METIKRGSPALASHSWLTEWQEQGEQGHWAGVPGVKESQAQAAPSTHICAPFLQSTSPKAVTRSLRCAQCCGSMNCISDFFTYETTKSVVVKSWTIGIINRAVQLLIISYFVG